MMKPTNPVEHEVVRAHEVATLIGYHLSKLRAAIRAMRHLAQYDEWTPAQERRWSKLQNEVAMRRREIQKIA